jgi:hypothetical protein
MQDTKNQIPRIKFQKTKTKFQKEPNPQLAVLKLGFEI